MESEFTFIATNSQTKTSEKRGFDGSYTTGLFGFRVNYSFTKNIVIREEWERYIDLDLLSVGLVFLF